MPRATVGLAGLAASGLRAFGLRLFHPPDASVMVLCLVGRAERRTQRSFRHGLMVSL
jgi:hypothetical protein